MADLVSIFLAVVLGGLLILWGKHYSLGWHGASKSGARLPKGSLGWPIIGETIEWVRNPAKYAPSHAARYGKVWKTYLAGQPLIMGTTPEFAKFVMSSDKIFVSAWPAVFKNIVGPEGIMFKDGPLHMSIKKRLQKLILPEALRNKVNTLETIVLENLASWEQKGTVNGRTATLKLTLDISLWFLLGVRNIGSTAEGRKAEEEFGHSTKALASLPFDIPGSPYNKGLKARAELTKYVKSLLEKRRSQGNTKVDMLGVLLAAQEDPNDREEWKELTDEMIAQQLLFMSFAAIDSTSMTLTWILKFLVDKPDVFRRIQAEQQEILKSKDPSADGARLSWEDTRKMVYTQKFLQEVHRVVSLVPFPAREATQDMEFEGHLIPKGWGVRPLYISIHSDPAIYPDPKSFNPDRFDVAPKPYTFMPFSAGTHICPGMELAKLIMLIYVHHITTTYTYEKAAADKGSHYEFFPVPTGGYPINIRRQKLV